MQKQKIHFHQYLKAVRFTPAIFTWKSLSINCHSQKLSRQYDVSLEHKWLRAALF